jgi:PLP dependent protein
MMLSDTLSIAERVAVVRGRISAAERAAGRDPGSVALVAVSKLHPAEAVRRAYEAGVRVFGENYAQELVRKAESLADLPDIAWHMIGHLQSNKARLVAPVVQAVHTVDSAGLAAELDRRARASGRVIDVLVEVNVAGEASKSGCEPDQAPVIADAVRSTSTLHLVGLMTMPPWTDDPEAARPCFARLRELRDRLGGTALLPHLSMGMSHDLEAAIAEGATLVRVGTAIFGERAGRP